MNTFAFIHFLFFGLPLIIGPSVKVQEVQYETAEFGRAVAVFSVRESALAVTAINSQDGRVFKLHRANGVFIDAGQPAGNHPEVKDLGLIRSVSQMRSAGGVDLILNLKQSAYVEPFLTADGLRFVFIARQDAEAKPSPVPDGNNALSETEMKIAELRRLVRDLSLEVLTLKKQLAEKQ